MNNLLKNGNFEGGWRDHPTIAEIQIPNGWRFGFFDDSTPNPIIGKDDAIFRQPEAVHLTRLQVPDWEEGIFGMQGEFIYKPFKGSGSIYFWLEQDVTLEPREYEFAVQVYPDVVMGYDSKGKIFADDANAALIRFHPSDHWESFNPVALGTHETNRLQTIRHRFTAPGGIYTVHVEFMLPFPLPQNGIFADNWTLAAVGEVEPPAPSPVQGSRLGTHNIAAASQYGNILDILYDWKAKGGRPSIIKAVNDFGWLPAAREIFPNVPIIGRVTSSIEGAGGVADPGANLEQMAYELMGLILEKSLDTLDLVDFFEVVNEPDPPGIFGYAQLARLMMECMKVADRAGLKLALFSLNAGTPEWDEMVEMCNAGVFEMAKAGGHILSLHEGVFDNDPIDKWHGDQIPGSPIVPSAGALCFRYRYLYHLLAQRDEVIPLIVSEFRTHGANYPKTTEEVLARYKWYDERARADDFVLGVTPFTLGARDQWFPSHDYGRDYPALIDYAVSVGDPPPVEPPDTGRGKPREQYERTYVLMPPEGEHELANEITRRYFDAFRFTIGGSADDAGVADLDKRSVVAVQPQNWGDDLRAFFEEYYPGVNYIPASGENDYQLMGRVLAALLKARGVKLVYPVTHQPPVVTSEFGVDRDTYFHNGLDLRASWARYQDEVSCAHDGTVLWVGNDPKEPWFGYQIKTMTTLPDGSDMQIRYAHLVDGGAYVVWGQTVEAGMPLGKPDNTGNSTGDHLHIDVKYGVDYADPAILIDWNGGGELPDVVPLLGLHDEGGGDWMMGNGITGVLLVHRPIHHITPEPIDMTKFERAGIQVIARWGYDYGGVGTVPPKAQEALWVSAMIYTINQSKGVYLHTLFNEWNNPAEWTGGYPVPREILTPERALDLYQHVAAGVRADIRLAPGAVDPYNVVAREFGQPGDPKTWFDAMHNSVDRVAAIVLHAKTQTNDAGECSSNERFSDEPLTGRYLHLRTYLDQLAWVKSSLRNLPVFVTECNPQLITGGTAAMLGWKADNAAWVTAAVGEFDRYNLTGAQRITGVCFYRYDLADGWGLVNKPVILDEIAGQARRAQ